MKTKSIIAALLLAASSAFAQVPSYVPPNGLVGWWPFNGNANDESGNGNNGTVNGPTSFSDRSGNVNSSYKFSKAQNSFIKTSYNTNQNANTFSYSFWINPDSLITLPIEGATSNGTGGIVSSQIVIHPNHGACYGSPSTNAGTGICVGSNGIVVLEHSANFVKASLVSPINILGWNNISLVYINKIPSIYLNGVLIKTGLSDSRNVHASYGFDNNTIANYSNSGFGAGFNGPLNNGYFYSGLIDDIGIWNRALNQQEITALYNAQTCNSSSNAITADGPTTFCAGNFVNLKSDVVGGTYQWRKNGVNIATNSSSRTFKATSTGSYTCVATCNSTALTSNAIQVTSQTNAAVTLSATGATSFCAGDSITLNATNLGSGYSVQWYRTNISMQGVTNYSVVVKQPGTYKTVTKNLTTGCSRISSSSVVVAVNCRLANPDIIAVDPVNDEMPATKLGNSTETTMHLFPNPNAGSFTLEYDGIEADFEVQVVNTMGQVIYNDIIPSNDKHLKTTINLGDNMQKGIYVVRIINGENVQESKVMLQ